MRAIEDDPFFRVPPGFSPLDLHGDVDVYDRYLPHWRQDGATYFVTVRQVDAMPPALLRQLKQERIEFLQSHGGSPSKAEWQRFRQQQSETSEGALDNGYGSCALRSADLRAIVQQSLLFYHGSECHVGCFVVMPNHWHLLIRPFSGVPLEGLLRRIKGYSAWRINRSSGHHGSFWGLESYDRLVRDASHLISVMRYIVFNGRKAGLTAAEHTVWVNPEWEAAGWTADALIAWSPQ
jgi:putative transposase